jgi:hypothetical protein
MGCLLSKLFNKQPENPEVNPYNYLFEPDNQRLINPIYFNDSCKDENGVVYI